jgi:hypothetical protein
MSVAPPGANGTTMWTGRAGQSSALAWSENRKKAAQVRTARSCNPKRLNRLRIDPPYFEQRRVDASEIARLVRRSYRTKFLFKSND